MKAAEFETIKMSLAKYIKQTMDIVDACTVNGKIEFAHLTICQLNDLSESARTLQSETDQFLKQDLYHIIGMGELSAVQSAALNKLVKDITSPRSIIKAVAALPKIPNKMSKTIATYKVSTVGLTLTKQFM